MQYLPTVIVCFFMVSGSMIAQEPSSIPDLNAKVFYIGEDEREYEKLVRNYNVLLFTVCENNMEKAYDSWSLLLKEIEDFSISKYNLDIKGVKLWFNVFWSKDGTIDYIVFYPKPNSKNLNYETVKTMLKEFSKSYQSPIRYTSKFSHYGSAAFPVFSKSIIGTEK